MFCVLLFQEPQERDPDPVLERDSERRQPPPHHLHRLPQLQVPLRVHHVEGVIGAYYARIAGPF